MASVRAHSAPNPVDYDCNRFQIIIGDSIDGHSEVCDRLLAYWLHKRHGDRLPARADIHLHELRRDAPHVAILDIVRNPDHVCGFSLPVRLTGTAVAGHYGERTGQDICRMTDWGPGRRVCQMVQHMLVQRAPVMSAVHGVSSELPFKDSFTLYLPLASDGVTVDKVLLVLDMRYQE